MFSDVDSQTGDADIHMKTRFSGPKGGVQLHTPFFSL